MPQRSADQAPTNTTPQDLRDARLTTARPALPSSPTTDGRGEHPHDAPVA
ncbi:hypothetical protein [Frondihabitans sucicola]|nr:hypothetical protein [Frondihabitans sucicola]